VCQPNAKAPTVRLFKIRQTCRFSDKSWSNPNPDLPAGQAGVFMSGSRWLAFVTALAAQYFQDRNSVEKYFALAYLRELRSDSRDRRATGAEGSSPWVSMVLTVRAFFTRDSNRRLPSSALNSCLLLPEPHILRLFGMSFLGGGQPTYVTMLVARQSRGTSPTANSISLDHHEQSISLSRL